jgi:NOL1/NOP2/fmu family ribosome biogenesis protein
LGVLSAGVAIATVCKNRLEPCHSAFITSTMDCCKKKLNFLPGDPQLLSFLHGEEISCPEKGWTAVCVAGIPVGFGKASGGKLKNRYPKGLRLL